MQEKFEEETSVAKAALEGKRMSSKKALIREEEDDNLKPASKQVNQMQVQVQNEKVARELVKRRSSLNAPRKRKVGAEKRLKMDCDEEVARSDTPTGELLAGNGENICAACARPIKERYLLVALDKQWHEDCLKCACCDCRLGEVGSSLFTHADKILCRRDFLRIFGRAGHCAACKKSIPPYELVMRAQENAYHMDCFACQQCQYRFCVGDRFHLTEAHCIVCTLCHSEAGATPAPLGSAAGAYPQPAGLCNQQEEKSPMKQQQQSVHVGANI